MKRKIMTMAITIFLVTTTACSSANTNQTGTTPDNMQQGTGSTTSALAGEARDVGIYEASYVNTGDSTIAALDFDSNGALMVDYFDQDGKESTLLYNVEKGEKTGEGKAIENALTDIKNPDYLENPYVGENTVYRASDESAAVTFNEYEDSNTDGYIRIYKDKTLIYRGLEMPDVTFVSAAQSLDGKYIAILCNTGDAQLGDEVETHIYLADMTLLSTVVSKMQTDELPSESEMMGYLQNVCKVNLVMVTNKDAMEKALNVKKFKGNEKECIAKVYTMFQKFPDAFYVELNSKDRGIDYGNLNIYLCSGMQSQGGNAYAPAGRTYTDEQAKERYIILDTTLNPEHLVQLLAHEYMHILDVDIIANSKELDKWDSYLPKGVQYHNAYVDSNGEQFDDVKYTTQDTEGNSDVYFVSNYSITYATEDRATLFEVMFSGRRDDMELLQNNEKLKEKADYLAEALRASFPSLSNSSTLYWEGYQQYKF